MSIEVIAIVAVVVLGGMVLWAYLRRVEKVGSKEEVISLAAQLESRTREIGIVIEERDRERIKNEELTAKVLALSEERAQLQTTLTQERKSFEEKA